MKDLKKIQSECNVTLEEALTRTGFGKFNYALIVLTGAVLGCVVLETVSINFILPVAQCDLSLTTQNKGVLSAIGFVGMIFSSHLWGFLADTRGRKTVIVPTLFIAFGITVLSSFSKSFWFLVLMRFLNGFFISGPSACIYAYLGEFHSIKHRSQALMFASILYAVICLLNPLFGVIFINQEWNFYIEPIDLVFKPWRLFMIICGTPNVVCGLVMLFFIPESPKFYFYQGRRDKSLEILKKMFKLNTGKSEESFNVKALESDDESGAQIDRKSMNILEFMWSQTVPLFKHPHLKNTLTACFIQFCIFNTSNGFWTFFPEITNRIALWKNNSSHVSATVCEILDDTKFSPELNGNGTSIDSSSCVTKLELSTYANAIILISLYVVGYIVIAFIINKTGKLVIIIFFLFGSAFSSILLMFINIPSTLTYIYISMLTVGIAFNVVNASTVELYPTNLRAMAICISLMIGRLGCVVGSNIIGLMLDQFCQYTFLMPTVLLICSGCLASTIPNISKRV